jgi:hypothetical protein
MSALRIHVPAQLRSPWLAALLAPFAGYALMEILPLRHLLGNHTMLLFFVVWLLVAVVAGLLFGSAYPRWWLTWGPLLGSADLLWTIVQSARWNDNLGPPGIFLRVAWIAAATTGSLMGWCLRRVFSLVARTIAQQES